MHLSSAMRREFIALLCSGAIAPQETLIQSTLLGFLKQGMESVRPTKTISDSVYIDDDWTHVEDRTEALWLKTLILKETSRKGIYQTDITHDLHFRVSYSGPGGTTSIEDAELDPTKLDLTKVSWIDAVLCKSCPERFCAPDKVGRKIDFLYRVFLLQNEKVLEGFDRAQNSVHKFANEVVWLLGRIETGWPLFSLTYAKSDEDRLTILPADCGHKICPDYDGSDHPSIGFVLPPGAALDTYINEERFATYGMVTSILRSHIDAIFHDITKETLAVTSHLQTKYDQREDGLPYILPDSNSERLERLMGAIYSCPEYQSETIKTVPQYYFRSQYIEPDLNCSIKELSVDTVLQRQDEAYRTRLTKNVLDEFRIEYRITHDGDTIQLPSVVLKQVTYLKTFLRRRTPLMIRPDEYFFRSIACPKVGTALELAEKCVYELTHFSSKCQALFAGIAKGAAKDAIKSFDPWLTGLETDEHGQDWLCMHGLYHSETDSIRSMDSDDLLFKFKFNPESKLEDFINPKRFRIYGQVAGTFKNAMRFVFNDEGTEDAADIKEQTCTQYSELPKCITESDWYQQSIAPSLKKLNNPLLYILSDLRAELEKGKIYRDRIKSYKAQTKPA